LCNRRFATPNGINGGETNRYGVKDQIIITAQYRDITIDDVGFVKRKTKWGMWESMGHGARSME
jgi:hypothetical protein